MEESKYPPGPPTFGDANPIRLEEPEANPPPPPVDPDNPPWGFGTAILVWLASLALMFFVPLIFIIPYAAVVGFSSFDPMGKTSILLQVAAIFPIHLLTFGLVWLVVTRFGKQDFRNAIGWGWGRGFRLWSSIVLGILLFIVASVLAKLLGAEKPTELERIINSSLTARYMISFLAVCTAPFVEEFIYRGVIYAGLRRDAGRFMAWLLNLTFDVKLGTISRERMGVWTAVTLVLALFTIIHVPQYWPNLGVIVAVALLSIVLTVVRAYSGRLLPCIVIHLVFNGVQAILLILEPHPPTYDSQRRAGGSHRFIAIALNWPLSLKKMDCEVVVVGGGIGGLTVAALLAARGVDVCLLERESRVGGCVTSFEKFGYRFEPGYGLHASWRPNEVHDRVFSELPVEPPEVRLLEPGYLVRLPDKSEISLTADQDTFENNLREVFPECADNAISFYRKLGPLSAALQRVVHKTPGFLGTSRSRQAYSLLSEGRVGAQLLASSQHSTLQHLDGVSTRFRRFIDVQLQALAQGGTSEVSYLYAAQALTAPRGGLFGIRGGPSALADKLADSIRQSGSRIRLNTPVLRLSYDSTETPVGVDLLSGETVTASKAIISNLTLWDTYGKLVGLNRTPTEVRKELKSLWSWGAYLLYLGLDEDSESSFSPSHVLALNDWQDLENYEPENSQLFFSAAPSWDLRAPDGKRAVTVHSFTDVDAWFTFHTDETELEQKDQVMLEACWQRLHAAMPELGNRIEVIETATPRTYYEQTRRKLGMVGGVIPTPESFWTNKPRYLTCYPNLFIVSDTTSAGGIAGVTNSALALANRLTGRT